MELMHKNSVVDLESLHAAHLAREEKKGDDVDDLMDFDKVVIDVPVIGVEEDEPNENPNKQMDSSPAKNEGTMEADSVPPQRVLDYKMPSDTYERKGYMGKKKGPLYKMAKQHQKKNDIIQNFVANLPWNKGPGLSHVAEEEEDERADKEGEGWQSILVPELAYSESGSPSKPNSPSSASSPGQLETTSSDDNEPQFSIDLGSSVPVVNQTRKGILKNVSSNSVDGNRSRSQSDSDSVSSAASSYSMTSTSMMSRDSQGRPRRKLFPNVPWYSKVPLSSLRKGRVRFASKARMFLDQPKDDSETWEDEDVWWQKEDYADFRDEGDVIADAVEDGSIWIGSEDEPLQDKVDSAMWCEALDQSARGLEHILHAEKGQERLETVERSIHAVLREQDDQRDQASNGSLRQELLKQQQQQEQRPQSRTYRIRHVYLKETGMVWDTARNKGFEDAIQAATDEGHYTWEYEQWKGYRETRKLFCLIREKRAAVVIQKGFRDYSQAVELEKKRYTAATCIQTAFRQRNAEKTYSQQRAAIVSIQTQARIVMATRQLEYRKLQKAAATTVQTCQRKISAKAHYSRQRRAVVMMQSCARQFLASARFKSSQKAAIRIQSWSRMVLAKRAASSSGEPILQHLKRNLEVQRLLPEDLYLNTVCEGEDEQDKEDEKRGVSIGSRGIDIPQEQKVEKKFSRWWLVMFVLFVILVLPSLITWLYICNGSGDDVLRNQTHEVEDAQQNLSATVEIDVPDIVIVEESTEARGQSFDLESTQDDEFLTDGEENTHELHAKDENEDVSEEDMNTHENELISDEDISDEDISDDDISDEDISETHHIQEEPEPEPSHNQHSDHGHEGKSRGLKRFLSRLFGKNSERTKSDEQHLEYQVEGDHQPYHSRRWRRMHRKWS